MFVYLLKSYRYEILVDKMEVDGQRLAGWMEWRVTCGKWDVEAGRFDAETGLLTETCRRGQCPQWTVDPARKKKKQNIFQ